MKIIDEYWPFEEKINTITLEQDEYGNGYNIDAEVEVDVDVDAEKKFDHTIEDEDEDDEEDVVYDIDQYGLTFSDYDAICQCPDHQSINQQSEGKNEGKNETPCVTMNIAGFDVSICLQCYLNEYRPCIYSGSVFNSTEMIQLGNNIYCHNSLLNHFKPFIQCPSIGIEHFLP